MKNNRGMSSVVASVLLILITISAVAIISTFIIEFTDKSLKSTECFDFRDYFSFDQSFDYNCRDESNGIYLISVKSRPDNSSSEFIDGLSLRFMGDGNTATEHIIGGTPTGIIEMMDERIGNGRLVIPKSGSRYSALTYNYSSNEIYNKIEVYALLKGGKICDMSDSIEIVPC